MNIMRSDTNQRQGLIDLIDNLEISDGVMLEVGSYLGDSTRIFAESKKFKTICCVDFWQSDYDAKDFASNNMSGIENIFDNLVNQYSQTIKKYKNSSNDVKFLFPDDYFDFIYIDANHNYEFVKSDIITCLPKLKNNGWIAGHDYQYPLFDVDKAVDEILGKPDKVFVDTSWIKKIKK